MYEVNKFNTVLANATQNVIYGRPDLWIELDTYDDLVDALEDGSTRKCDVSVREAGESRYLWRNVYVRNAFVVARHARKRKPDISDSEMIALVNRCLYVKEDSLWYKPLTELCDLFLEK